MGGAPSIPADNSLAIARFEAQQAEQARLEKEAREQREKEEFNQRIAEALSTARATGENVVSQRGLSPETFDDLISSTINRLRGTIPDLDPTPGAFFDPSVFESALDTERDAQRSQFQNQLNAIAPTGFASTLLPNTADDDIVNAILSGQRGEASDTIQNARARGLLTDFGFNDATRRLEGQSPLALSTLQDTGLGILEQGRQDLRGVASEGRINAGLFELGGTFNPEDVRGRLETTTGEFLSGLDPRLRAAAPTGLFTVDDIISRAQAGQGVANVAGAPLAEVLAQREQKRQDPRGLGTQGAF